MTSRVKTLAWVLITVIAVIVVVGIAKLPVSAERREKAEAERRDKAEIEALRACRDEQDPAKRIERFEQFLEDNPQGKYRRYAHSYIFRTYLADVADTVEALSYARGVLASSERADDKAQLYPALMSFWREAGADDSVVACARQALAASVTDGSAYNEMGYELAEAGTHLDLAVELCRKAVELAEDDLEKSIYYDSLGWAYYKAGKPLEAVEALQLAGKLAGEDVDQAVLEHLAAAQVAAGKPEEAIETYLGVMSLGEFEEVRAELGRLYTETRGSSETLDADIAALRKEKMTPAPDFALRSTAGEEIGLSKHKGKVVLLNFMSPT